MNVHFQRISLNSKTGPIPVTMTERKSCPTSCPLRKACYANFGYVKKSKTWDFDEWFTAQHGKCPGGRVPTEELGKRVATATHVLHAAVVLYKSRRAWEDRYTSARYAWNIKDKQKTVRRKK